MTKTFSCFGSSACLPPVADYVITNEEQVVTRTKIFLRNGLKVFHSVEKSRVSRAVSSSSFHTMLDIPVLRQKGVANGRIPLHTRQALSGIPYLSYLPYRSKQRRIDNRLLR
jgi:hypothetical protein